MENIIKENKINLVALAISHVKRENLAEYKKNLEKVKNICTLENGVVFLEQLPEKYKPAEIYLSETVESAERYFATVTSR
ncbi:MAG: hypothetical protein HW399_786 [Dehalococcoidia bacterium]|nr:hypothetical protein [Dehalococcoidia bacterium]